MKIDLKWDEECWDCDGAGKRTKDNNLQNVDSWGRCGRCEGTGFIKTEEGQELIDFLARHRVLG